MARSPSQVGAEAEIPSVEILGVIGTGGFGTVFAGRDGHGRPVAVKIAHRANDLRFQREAEALRSLGPPVTPALYATGTTTDGRIYLIQERLFGQTLAEWLAALPGDGSASVSTVVSLFVPLCQAVAAVHGAGIVHRDLKPENVFFRWPEAGRRTVTLLDFGLSRPLADAKDSPPALELTRTGQQLGSTHYMSPEQLTDPRRVNERADLYALGAMLYECLVGRPPFVGDEPTVRHAHAASRPTPPSQRVAAAAPLDPVILRCLAKDPEQRYPSAAALGEAIAAAIAGPGRDAVPSSLPSPSAPRASASLRTVGLIGVRCGLPVTKIAAVAEGEGGFLARAREDGYLLLFPQLSAEAAVRAARRAGRALESLLVPTDRLVLHAAEVRLWETSRGVTGMGPPLDSPSSWWPSDDRLRGVSTTAAAEALLAEGTSTSASSPDAAQGQSAIAEGGAPWQEPVIPLMGRDDLLAMMVAEAERAFAGATPVMTTLVGEVGYGKSRLLNAVADRLSGRAHVVKMQFPSPEAANFESATTVLRRAVLAAGGEDLALPAGVTREVLAKAMAAALRPVAGRPTAVLVDDAHWAEPSVLDALELATMEGGTPLWIVAATNPEFLDRRPQWGDRALSHLCHRLQPLSGEAERALLRHLLQPAEYIPADVLGAVQDMARGIPLLAVEIGHALREGGAFRRSPGQGGWYLAGDELLRVSSTPLAARLAHRLMSRLPPSLRAFVELCAVLGDGFSRSDAGSAELAVTIADAPTTDALDPEVAFDRLVREGVLHRDAQGRHLFRHPMLRASIEEAIPAPRRRQLHEIVLRDLLSRPGAGVSRAVIARHADRCGAHEEAFTHHFFLAEQARAAHSELVAEEHYTAALAHLSDGDARRGAVFAGRAKVRSRVQRFSDALQDLHASYPHAEARGDHRAIVELLLEEATIHDWRETWQACADLVARAAPLVQQADDPRLRARWLMALGRTRFREGKLEPAAIHLAEAHALAGKVSDHETWAIAGMLLGHVLVSTGRLDEAEALLGTVIDSCERAHDTLHLCSAYNNRIWLWLKRESLEQAIADQRRATTLAREIGHVQLERSCTYNLAEFLYWRGELAEALVLARRARDLQTRFLDEVPVDALLVARISVAKGDLSTAREELDWVLARCPEERRSPLVDTQVRMVELMVNAARPDASESWRGLVDRARRIPSVYYEVHEVVHFAAMVALREQRRDDARRYLEEGTRLAGPTGVWRERFARLRQALDGSSHEVVAFL